MRNINKRCGKYIVYAGLVIFLVFSGCRGKENNSGISGNNAVADAGSGGNDIFLAALEGDIEVVLRLLEEGEDVNARDEEGRTALMYASFNGFDEIVGKLIEEGAEVNLSDNYGRTPLIFASSGPFPGTTMLLLENGADIDVFDDEEHFTALMYAAAEGQAGTVEILLSYGANPDMKDIDGEMALDFARNNGHQEIVRLLEPY